jgi:membrane-bound lytic murein transglycosylase B
MSDRRHLLIGLCGLATGCGAAASPSAEAPRRNVASGPAAGATEHAAAGGGPFDQFLNGVRADARRSGISQATLQRAFAGLQPNQRIIELDRRQSEAVLTWEEYRERIVSPTRIETGRRNYAEGRGLLERIGARYGVSPRVVVAIWGMETNYGANTGGFGVVEALATLAWEGRRAGYFRGELLSALRILDAGHVAPERMRGSWAGAMGQPQFMPSNFERLAVDFDGDGRRDIWDNRADALGSIAHYLSRHGWREGEPWGLEVLPPGPVEGYDADTKRPLREWARLGFRRVDGGPLPSGEVEMAPVQPNRSSGKVFLGGHNLRVIRRYNSPINYGLAVGLLSDRVA